MRALQELIPRCNKVCHVYDSLIFSLSVEDSIFLIFILLTLPVTDILLFSESQSDKASMLDEAIEYLKSLQLQVQVCLCLIVDERL